MNDKYSVENELTSKQFDQALALSQQMWWSKERTHEELETMLKHCMPFAVIDNSTQRLVGFARVLTDEVRYAYIYDVMIEEELRGNGIGKLIMQSIVTHPQLSRVKYFELTCTSEFIEYYNKFGFSSNFGNVISMRRNKEH